MDLVSNPICGNRPGSLPVLPTSSSSSPSHSHLHIVTLCKHRRLTQLLAQFASNPLLSAPQLFSAASLCVKLSTMLFLSRHWKYISLASQHFARADRSGAIGVPSVEIFGAGSLSLELEKKPIVSLREGGWIWRSFAGSVEVGAVRSSMRSLSGPQAVTRKLSRPSFEMLNLARKTIALEVSP